LSSASGLANHSLYMARLLLNAWSDQLTQQRAESNILEAAFGPAVRLHLLDAYGWFLLAVVRLTPLPKQPPHSTSDLPKLSQGIAEPNEIAEYRELECDGWLAGLQAMPEQGVERPLPPGRLASTIGRLQVEDYTACSEELESLINRMSTGLDEC